MKWLSVLATSMLLLACATTTKEPVRVPNMTYSDTDQIAYIWSHGINLDPIGLTDYAYSTRIDGYEVPPKYMSQELLL